MEFTGERHLPGEAGWLMDLEHNARYAACLPMCKGRRVLDIACGSGYGSATLGSVASEVIGADIDQDAISFARATYAAPNISFVAASVSELPFEVDSFDVLVSFETFEHVDEDSQRRFLDEARRVLRPGGTLVISTPDRRVSELRGTVNEFHVHEVTADEFVEQLRSKFRQVTLYRQDTWVYSEILPLGQTRCATEVSSPEATGGQNLIAVCSDQEAAPALASLMRSADSYHDILAAERQRWEQVHQRAIADVYESSLSWRLSGPVRLIGRLLRRG